MYGNSFIKSGGSNFSVVSCEEFSPPPPPGDFMIWWDFSEEKLILMWALPVVRTRDVKRFQVFRRKNIKEPFELLAE